MKITNNKVKITIFGVIISLGLGFAIGLQTLSATETPAKKVPVSKVVAPAKTNVSPEVKTTSELPYTSSLTIASNPSKYLNKKVKIRAKFDKFSVLGLDYKPAFKSSEKYITFLIKRDDVINNVVPLSEMKNFILRSTAEKYIDLKPGDEIEYTGIVFSDALSDTWIDVDSFKVISSNTKTKTKNSDKK